MGIIPSKMYCTYVVYLSHKPLGLPLVCQSQSCIVIRITSLVIKRCLILFSVCRIIFICELSAFVSIVHDIVMRVSKFCSIIIIIIHQTHYEKSDWSRAFNQFTIACELDMINAISAADIAFIMSSSTSAWLPSPLGCSPQKLND